MSYADKQCGFGVAFPVMPVKLCKIYVADNIGIVHKKGFVAVQKGTRFLYSATGVEQSVPFIADVDGGSEIIVGAEKLDDLIDEMVDVDRNIIESGIFQP